MQSKFCTGVAVVCALVWQVPVFAQAGLDRSPHGASSGRYALFLADPPVTSRYTSRDAIAGGEAQSYRQQIEAKQKALMATLKERNIPVVGSVATALNAVFVNLTADRVEEMKSLPGVTGVVRMRRGERHLNQAVQLMNAPAAWNLLGGVGSAGAGIKIGVIDTGIDQTHPAFQDSSLSIPAGFPKCTSGDCAYTNNKVIVARSYVKQIGAGVDPKNPAATSEPDDFSARDHDGHGTAVASVAAANVNNGGVVTFNGMAPKAFLGNYKVYGSPGVNDFPTEDIYIMAIDDAMNDGMDIVNFSSGLPALSGPLDTGSTCGNPTGVACDLLATAFENVAKSGMVVTVSAGNNNGTGSVYPTFNIIASPASAPSVISVGASTNSHFFGPTVSVPGAASSLQKILAQNSDGFGPIGALTAPLIDVTQLGNDGYACAPLPAGSLNGAFALIERGPAVNACPFSIKGQNAQNAGAIGVVFYMLDSSATITPEGLDQLNNGLFVMISNADGLALKTYIDANSGHAVIVDPAGQEETISPFNLLASYSSVGPNTGNYAIKPELVATGGLDPNNGPDPNDINLIYGYGMYVAAENYDPNGEVYSSNRYTAADGTSFSSPITAGAAALLKQKNPNWTAAQIKSALVNSTKQGVTTTDDFGDSVNVEWIGAGLLDAGAAIGATVFATPTTASFGVVSSLPATQTITLTNSGSSSVTLSANIVPDTTVASPATTVSVSPTSVILAAGASGTLTVSLTGTAPSPGAYDGQINLTGGGVTLHIPYLFLKSDGVPSDFISMNSNFIDGTVGTDVGVLNFKVVDQYGVAIPNSQVGFSVNVSQGGSLTLNTVPGAPACTPASATDSVTCPTDANGIAWVDVVLGTAGQPLLLAGAATGDQIPTQFYVRPQPTIPTGGVVNAASNLAPIAAGSYVSIYGTNLADPNVTGNTTTTTLPLVINQVTVSFDTPSASISVPGYLIFESPGQVNVQVPWELQGQTSAQVKVTIDQFSYGNVVTVPLATYSPAFYSANGIVSALDANYSQISATNPATHGQVLQLFANGLGPVSNQPASGVPAPGSPLALTKAQPTVSIGGQNAPVQFSGLAPGFPGLNQINVTVPAGLTAGTYPITLSIGGVTSPAVNVPVQ